MKNKWLLTLLITIIALPIFASNVLAETEVVYEDGTYDDVPMTVKFGETVFDQFSETATIEIKDGNQHIQFAHTQTDVILNVTVPEGEVELIDDEENKTREVGFNYEGNLNEPIPFTIHMFYGSTHDMHAYLDMSNVPVVTPSEPEPEEDENKPEKEFIELVKDADEEYLIDFVSESPAVNGQFNNPATLLYKDGKKYIQLSGTGGQFIEWLSINGTKVDWGEQNEAGEFVVQFVLEGNLSAQLDFGMLINAGGREMEHDVDLTFDENTKRSTDEDAQIPDESDEDKDEVDESTETDEKEEAEVPKVTGELVPDSAKQIDYTILQDDNDKVSAADAFLEKPAILLEKDGNRYLQITTKPDSGKFIKSLRVKLGDKYQEMVIVEKTADGRTIFQMKVDGNVSDVILLDMVIDVAGVYENQYHQARLFLDEASVQEVDASQYLLVASTNGNGPNAPKGEEAVNPEAEAGAVPRPSDDNENNTNGTANVLDPKTPAKPVIGDGDINGTVSANGPSGNALNPQTGENTNLLMYVLLLIGSAIPLAIKAKRRFA